MAPSDGNYIDSYHSISKLIILLVNSGFIFIYLVRSDILMMARKQAETFMRN